MNENTFLYGGFDPLPPVTERKILYLQLQIEDWNEYISLVNLRIKRFYCIRGLPFGVDDMYVIIIQGTNIEVSTTITSK